MGFLYIKYPSVSKFNLKESERKNKQCNFREHFIANVACNMYFRRLCYSM
jgi:hypothetical protein